MLTAACRLGLMLCLLAGVMGAGVYGQGSLERQRQQAVLEGREMFFLEMAAWQGTDVMRDYLEGRSLKGYLAYRIGDSIRTIFYDDGSPERIALALHLDSTASPGSRRADTVSRAATSKELVLIRMREAITKEIEEDDAGFFSFYENTGLNIVLLPGSPNVGYVLTAPHTSGVILFGNDYRFEFDEAGRLLRRKKVHEGIYIMEIDGREAVAGHVHEGKEPDLITSTDICTLMLYSQFTFWTFHVVKSDQYVSSWNIKEQALHIFTRKVWERLYADGEQQKGKN